MVARALYPPASKTNPTVELSKSDLHSLNGSTCFSKAVLPAVRKWDVRGDRNERDMETLSNRYQRTDKGL